MRGLRMTKNIKRIIAGLLILTTILALAACGKKSEQASYEEISSEAAVAEREFTDDCGRTVTLPGKIERVSASGPLSEMIVYSIAPDLLVTTAEKHNDDGAEYLSEDYLNLPYLGSLYGSADLNVEELALADPQIVIDIGEAKKTITEDMDGLKEQTGIDSIHLEASLETLPEMYRKLGKILGREKKAEELAAFCEKVYDRTVGIMEKVGDKKVKALYILGDEGLNVLAKDSLHGELVDMLTDNQAVVDNPSGKGTGNEISMEQIALWNPEFIIFGPKSIYSKAATMDNWANLNAIQSGKYVEVPYGPHNWIGMPPSVQRTLGLIWLTSVLYPEYCDYDVKAEVKEYYNLFYGCDLSDAQYEKLTANAFVTK